MLSTLLNYNEVNIVTMIKLRLKQFQFPWFSKSIELTEEGFLQVTNQQSFAKGVKFCLDPTEINPNPIFYNRASKFALRIAVLAAVLVIILLGNYLISHAAYHGLNDALENVAIYVLILVCALIYYAINRRKYLVYTYRNTELAAFLLMPDKPTKEAVENFVTEFREHVNTASIKRLQKNHEQLVQGIDYLYGEKLIDDDILHVLHGRLKNMSVFAG